MADAHTPVMRTSLPFAPLAELPEAIVRTDGVELAPHVQDWRGQKQGAAVALLLPRSTADVQDILRWAGRHGVAVVPQGGNTGLVGGSVPEPDGAGLGDARVSVVLSLRRLNHIEAVDGDSLTALVGAGVVLEHLHQACEAQGCRFPLSLGSKGTATIGGLVSTNAGGVQVLRHGPMRSLVLGLEAVLPDGTILDQLSALRKDNSGYDIKQLLIGAEGTLGVVTRVALKLAPALSKEATGWAGVHSAQQALALLGHLRRRFGERIESFELMAGEALALVCQYFPQTRPPIAADCAFHVLIEAEVEPDALQEALMEALEAEWLVDAMVAQSRSQSKALWAIREQIPLAEKQSGAAVKNDISVAVDRLADFHRDAMALFAREMPGARPFVFGHLGDGNLHWNLRPPQDVGAADSPAWVAREGAGARRLLHDLIKAYEGSISAEHGIGTLKAAELARLGDPGKLGMMRMIKKAVDPAGILNPGKIFV